MPQAAGQAAHHSSGTAADTLVLSYPHSAKPYFIIEVIIYYNVINKMLRSKLPTSTTNCVNCIEIVFGI